MEKLTTSCKLCLTVITGGNFKEIDELVREVLDIVLLKLNVEQNRKSVMCNACSEKLFAAFNFKVTCMDTEDSIFPYVDSKNVTLVDLKEIYLKLRNKEHLSSVLEDERICRLCMQFITCGFTTIEKTETDMIQKYIPEVNFNSTRDPVLCSLCLDSLNTHSNFLRNCLDVQNKITNNNEDCTTESISSIKNENIDIKSEEYDECGDTPSHGDQLVNKKISGKDSTNFYGLNLKTYKCDTCDFKTKYKSSIFQHQLKHKDFSEVQVYNCDKCDYRSKRRKNFISHQIIHKDISEVQIYSCDKCDFKTKRKSCLTRHQLKHKDISELKMYKCDKCDFKTKRSSCLITHQLMHKDISEVQLYKCDMCDYKSNQKGNLMNHQLKHKDISEVQVYKCDKCGFKARRKNNLLSHLLRHNDLSEVPVYKCDSCDYKTKYKSYLTVHQIKHKDFSEVQIYKCGNCDFKTKRKNSLRNHQRLHKDV